MVYIKLFVDYLDAIEPLGDAERGRLFTALLQYARTGEAPQLNGNERFIFPMMRAQIDRDEAALEELSSIKREAGRKGGLAKASKAKQNKQMLDLPSKTSKEKEDDKDKDKEKGKEKKDNNKNAPTQDDALSRVMKAYLDRIDPLPSDSSLDMLKGYVETLGADVCLRAIDRAIDARARNWNYIRTILQNCQKDGIRSIEDWDRKEEQRFGTKGPTGRDAGGDTDKVKELIKKWNFPGVKEL